MLDEVGLTFTEGCIALRMGCFRLLDHICVLLLHLETEDGCEDWLRREGSAPLLGVQVLHFTPLVVVDGESEGFLIVRKYLRITFKRQPLSFLFLFLLLRQCLLSLSLSLPLFLLILLLPELGSFAASGG